MCRLFPFRGSRYKRQPRHRQQCLPDIGLKSLASNKAHKVAISLTHRFAVRTLKGSESVTTMGSVATILVVIQIFWPEDRFRFPKDSIGNGLAFIPGPVAIIIFASSRDQMQLVGILWVLGKIPVFI